MKTFSIKRSGVAVKPTRKPWVLLTVAMAMCVPEIHGEDATGSKRVIINKSEQSLRAYEGRRLVFKSRVSTGREGRRTPTGRFETGAKERMHRSKLYHNAPMPYSVHIGGNYFIHGYSSVPEHPASHGCIRLPMSDANAAKRFYRWVEPGTPVQIVGRWGG